MRPPISSEKLTDTLTLSECHRYGEKPAGFWLYDKTRGMNLAMGAPSRELALIQAITYYQKRLSQVEKEHKNLSEKVRVFVSQFFEDGEPEI